MNRYVWSDFGGKREGLHETAEETACREFSEETLGLWGGMGDLRTRVSNSIHNIKTKVLQAMCGERNAEGSCFVLKNGLYINFVVPIQVLALAGGDAPKNKSAWPPLTLKYSKSIIQAARIKPVLSEPPYSLMLQYVDPLLFQLARDENDLLMASRPSSPNMAAPAPASSPSHADPNERPASSDHEQPGRFALDDTPAHCTHERLWVVEPRAQCPAHRGRRRREEGAERAGDIAAGDGRAGAQARGLRTRSGPGHGGTPCGRA